MPGSCDRGILLGLHTRTLEHESREELTIVRRAYAKQVLAWLSASNARLEAAFAPFLGPGPVDYAVWRICPHAGC